MDIRNELTLIDSPCLVDGKVVNQDEISGHIVPKAEGGKDQYKNYQLLHRHCHHQKTAEDKSRQGSARKASVC
jgi:5-methylcytosine-specific restriction endonuclease McrA